VEMGAGFERTPSISEVLSELIKQGAMPPLNFVLIGANGEMWYGRMEYVGGRLYDEILIKHPSNGEPSAPANCFVTDSGGQPLICCTMGPLSTLPARAPVVGTLRIGH